MNTDCYVISVCHTQRQHRYITFWRPDNCGYCWPLSWAGKYSKDQILAEAGYYNSGCSNIAIPCSVIDGMTVEPVKGYIDNDAGPCVENTRANWKLILANLVAQPQHAPEPQFPGAWKARGE